MYANDPLLLILVGVGDRIQYFIQEIFAFNLCQFRSVLLLLPILLLLFLLLDIVGESR